MFKRWQTLGLYTLMIGWSALSALLTWQLLAGEHADTVFSPRGALAILIEVSKFALWSYILRVKFRAGWLYVAILGVALMLVSAFASLHWFSADRARHVSKAQASVQESFEYKAARAAIEQDDKRIKSLQLASDEYNPKTHKTQIRLTQLEMDAAVRLRDRHMSELRALKPDNSEANALSSLGLDPNSQAINIVIVLIMELVPLGIVVILRDYKITTQTTCETTTATEHNHVKQYHGSVFSQESAVVKPQLSIVRVAPDDEDELYSDAELPSDETVNRAIKILNEGCKPSYESLRIAMRIGSDDVRRVFYVLRKRGVLVRDGKRHVLMTQQAVG